MQQAVCEVLQRWDCRDDEERERAETFPSAKAPDGDVIYFSGLVPVVPQSKTNHLWSTGNQPPPIADTSSQGASVGIAAATFCLRRSAKLRASRDYLMPSESGDGEKNGRVGNKHCDHQHEDQTVEGTPERCDKIQGFEIEMDSVSRNENRRRNDSTNSQQADSEGAETTRRGSGGEKARIQRRRRRRKRSTGENHAEVSLGQLSVPSQTCYDGGDVHDKAGTAEEPSDNGASPGIRNRKLKPRAVKEYAQDAQASFVREGEEEVVLRGNETPLAINRVTPSPPPAAVSFRSRAAKTIW